MAKNIAASRQKKPSGLSDKVSDIVLVVICAAVMLIVAYPLYYVLVASFSDPYDVYAGKTFLLPSQFTLKGYQAVFADSALFSGFINSIKYTVIGTIYSVVMIYLVAYPLSVKDLPGRKYISLFFVITMYFGGGLVPTYLIVKQTGLLGSMWALFLPGVVAVGNVIIVRNFFENNIPRELLEAWRLQPRWPRALRQATCIARTCRKRKSGAPRNMPVICWTTRSAVRRKRRRKASSKRRKRSSASRTSWIARFATAAPRCSAASAA